MEISDNLSESAKFAGTQIAPIKCFLCDKNFMVGDESYLMFEKRLTENDEEDASVATVLSSAIGKEINESTAHSKVLCDSCNEFVLEYELIEQRYLELKYKLIKDYNNVVKKYGTDIVFLEMTQEQIDQHDLKKDLIECDDLQPSRVELTTLDKNDIFEYLLDDKSFIAISSKDETKEAIDLNNLRETKDRIIKLENTLTEEIERNRFIDKNDIEINSDEVNFDQIVEQSQFSTDENTLDDGGDSNSLHFIADDNASIKSGDFAHFDLELQKPKLITTEHARPSFLFDGEKFFCLLCPDSEIDNENTIEAFDSKAITVHLEEKHDIFMVICSICGSGFSKKSDLLDHHEHTKCGMENTEYECEVCEKKFDTLKSYHTHKKIHSTTSSECHICKKKFLSKKLLDEHLNVHSGTRPFKCYICSKDFAAKYTLNSHMKIHSERERPYVCERCNKSFFTSANLQQHSRTHSSLKEFVCDVCQKNFATQHNLEIHKIVHTGHKPFLCRTCGKSFARRTEITDHERTHTGEKPFECDVCGIRFAQRSNLSTHKKSTHLNEKKHKCDTCGKSFKRRRLLDYHNQAAHTGERPYKCEICHSTFVYPEHYKKHLRIHSGVKPYPCEVCGKSFNSRDNRNAHRFIHSDKKPYECLTCGQGFMRKPLLYNHMQSVGHINDTIIVNQPRIKQTQETSESDNNEIQVIEDNSSFRMVMDTRVMLMEENDEMDEIVLEEEHLLDSIDGQDSINNTLNENDDCLVDEEILTDESYSVKKYFKKIV